jgi:hypothetical protein
VLLLDRFLNGTLRGCVIVAPSGWRPSAELIESHHQSKSVESLGAEEATTHNYSDVEDTGEAQEDLDCTVCEPMRALHADAVPSILAFITWQVNDSHHDEKGVFEVEHLMTHSCTRRLGLGTVLVRHLYNLVKHLSIALVCLMCGVSV